MLVKHSVGGLTISFVDQMTEHRLQTDMPACPHPRLTLRLFITLYTY